MLLTWRNVTAGTRLGHRWRARPEHCWRLLMTAGGRSGVVKTGGGWWASAQRVARRWPGRVHVLHSTIQAGEPPMGNVSVSGNTITFYSSQTCTGTGTYQWS